MNNMVVLERFRSDGKPIEELISCVCTMTDLSKNFHKAMKPSEAVIHHYNLDTLLELGWRGTEDKYFSPDSKIVWVCPKCVKKTHPHVKFFRITYR